MKKSLSIILIFLAFAFTSCKEKERQPEGKLFIIGGGSRPAYMVQKIIDLSFRYKDDYGIILPMASGEPDTSAYYATKQFTDLGFTNIQTFFIQKGNDIPESRYDSLRSASLIYLTGGDQSRFMDLIKGTPVEQSIGEAYKAGAVIAGTSAGAAVMSRKMITGNEFKHPEYTGDFRTIEAENMELKKGLGLLPRAVVDQHFVYRMRMNRLITVALENPGYLCIGIDESTALIVDKHGAEVLGESQVVLIQNHEEPNINEKGLIGGRGLELDILLSGDHFSLK